MSGAWVARAQALAFRRVEAATATEAIAEARTLKVSDGAEAVSYEVVLPQLGPDAFLLEKVLPRLVNFLDCRGVRLPGSGDVFVSLFTEQGLFFIDAGPLVMLLGQARGLDATELRRRYGAQGVGDPPLLGT